MKNFLFLGCLALCSVSEVGAQRLRAKIFTQAPLQYGVGLQTSISPRFSVGARTGILTKPYSTVIISTLEAFGTDTQITRMIDDAFHVGWVADISVNYHFKRNYVGLFGQYIGLHAGDAPLSFVESYFGETISSYPRRRNNPSAPVQLNLQSNLFQGGVLYGHVFPLRRPGLEIFTEVAVSANLGSNSELTTDNYDLARLSEKVNDELSYYYAHYCFIPSLTVGLQVALGARQATK